jgi:hypothetical protein
MYWYKLQIKWDYKNKLLLQYTWPDSWSVAGHDWCLFVDVEECLMFIINASGPGDRGLEGQTLSDSCRVPCQIGWLTGAASSASSETRSLDGYSPENTHTPWPEFASELYRQSDRRLSAKLVPTFEDRRCRVVTVTDPYGRILGFLDRSRYFFFQVAPQLYSRGWLDPVPGPLLLRKSGSAGNRTRTCGSVARNSDH